MGWISHYNQPEDQFCLAGESCFSLRNYSYFFPSLRQSLYHYFTGKSYKSILLPDYCPEGIYDPFKRLNFKIRFYHIKSNLQIDEVSLNCQLLNEAPDIFINIHHFGIFSESNREIVSRNIDSDKTLIIEDCAHTLPLDVNDSNAKLSLFSFPKMLGVPQGAAIRFNDKDLFEDFSYKADQFSSELRNKMNRAYWFNGIVQNYKLPDFVAGGFLKLFPEFKFYNYLMQYYDKCFEKLDHDQLEKLKEIKLNEVNAKRKAITENYLNNLSKNFLMDIERKSYLNQPLFNFPVKVDNQLKFSQYLYKCGIKGMVLKNRWWFDDPQPGELYNHHFLLPNNHNLRASDQEKIISVVNSY